MKIRIVKDRVAKSGFTLMLPSPFKWRRCRIYNGWFASKEEAQAYIGLRY
jgi:hypothetical protein